MPPTRAPFSALRSFSRFSQANSRTPLHVQPCPVTIFQGARHVRPFSSSFTRFNSPTDTSADKPQKSRLVEQPEGPQPPVPKRADQPSYDITFTCTPCSERSTHRITKQGYHLGSILVTCPSCKNRHVISDHLNVSAFK